MKFCDYCGAKSQELDPPDLSRPWKKMRFVHDNCHLHGVGTEEYHYDVLVRPSWDEIFMQIAHDISRRSSCNRLQVGSIVVSDDNQRILAMGYNGDHRGGSNRCDTNEPGACGCVHAETNCLIKLNPHEHVGKILYVTDAPCLNCAKLVVNSGIQTVVYDRDYRLDAGIKLLKNSGIDVRKYSKEE